MSDLSLIKGTFLENSLPSPFYLGLHCRDFLETSRLSLPRIGDTLCKFCGHQSKIRALCKESTFSAYLGFHKKDYFENCFPNLRTRRKKDAAFKHHVLPPENVNSYSKGICQ